MGALTIELDPITERRLELISLEAGESTDKSALRLLARALRSSRIRRSFNSDEIRRLNAQFEAEDIELAESGVHERGELLRVEDSL